MIKEFVRYWEVGKENLRDYFKKTKQEKYSEYKDLVVALFEYVINPGIQCDSGSPYCYGMYDTKKLTVIDDGDYQGTLLFVLPRRSYQPFVDDYVYTSVCYGSCSGVGANLAFQRLFGGKKDEKDETLDSFTVTFNNAVDSFVKCGFTSEEAIHIAIRLAVHVLKED